VSTEVQTLIPEQQSRSRMRTAIAWLVVLGLVGLVAYSNATRGRFQDYERQIVAEQARMFGMLFLQMKSWQTNEEASAAVHDTLEQWIRQIDKTSRTPEDKIRLSILAGENISPEAALMRLSELESNSSGELAADVRTIRTIYEDGPNALEPAAREKLTRRYGYLGRLALAYGVPANQEPRKSLLAEALRFVVRLSLLGMGFGALLMLSLGFFVAGCVWFFKGKITRAHIPNTSSEQVFLEAFALYLVLFLVSGRVLRFFGATSIQWTWITLLILPVVWKWAALRISAGELREAFGWHQGRGFVREAGAGLAGYFAGMPFIAVGCFVTILLSRYTGIQPGSPILQELAGSPLQIVGLYGVACVFAPVMEETMFRGALHHHLRQRWRFLLSAPIVSVIFAMLHPQGWVALPALGAIAMVLAGLREWRGSLIAPMAAHGFNNFLAVTAALLVFK
jgi:membrane protease YdiL (CAAX protease family)